jgi:hypothetical protein
MCKSPLDSTFPVYATIPVAASNLAALIRWLEGFAGCRRIKLSIGGTTESIELNMNPLRLLVDAFVNTFGITAPAPANEAKAGRMIAIMLIAVIVLLVVVGLVLRAAFLR